MKKLIFLTVLLFASYCFGYDRLLKEDIKPNAEMLTEAKKLLEKPKSLSPREARRQAYEKAKEARRQAHLRKKGWQTKRLTVNDPGFVYAYRGVSYYIKEIVDKDTIVIVSETTHSRGSVSLENWNKGLRPPTWTTKGEPMILEGVPTKELWVKVGSKTRLIFYVVNYTKDKTKICKYIGRF